MDMQQLRIRMVLGKECRRTPHNARRYYQYLQQAVALPCRLTGREDFPWEAEYLRGGWDGAAYREMKKELPSFMDHFDLLELLPPPTEGLGIIARVERMTDRKSFEIELAWLECTDFDDINYQLLDDYSSWSSSD